MSAAPIQMAQAEHRASPTPPPLFPAPRLAAEPKSLREFATALRNNLLTAFPPSAFEDEVFSRRFLWRHQIIFNRPASIRHVLVDNPGNYGRNAVATRLAFPLMGRNGLALAEGQEWREQRRTMAPAFAARTVPLLARHVGAAANRAVADLAAAIGPVDLYDRIQHLVLDVAGHALFSLDTAELRPRMVELLGNYADRHGRLSPLDMLLPEAIPTWGDLKRRRFRWGWSALVRELIARRRSQPAGAAAADLFDLLTAKTEGGDTVAPARLVDQVATMITTSYGTTTAALFWSLLLLTAVPAEQQLVADEAGPLDLGPDGAADALQRLPYTRAVIEETLRLYPPVHTIGRQANAADVAGGVPVPAGAIVIISPWLLHRHRRLWREPDRFDPTRFLPGAPPPDRYAYIPFGVGPRACIGAQFAMTEAVLALARLVQAFHVERVDDRVVTPFAAISIRPETAPLFRLRPRRVV